MQPAFRLYLNQGALEKPVPGAGPGVHVHAAVGEITIGVHRGQIMRKMGAKSLAELVRMADRLGIARTARPA